MTKSISRQQSNFVGRDPLRLLDLGLIRSRRPAYRYATLSRQASGFSSVAPTFRRFTPGLPEGPIPHCLHSL
jgi:hypothetical protein